MTTNMTMEATVIQILLWYDKPEIVLLQTIDQDFILAVRSGRLDSPNFVYVGGSMTSRRLRDYANGKCDLRFAIAHANTRKFWRFEMLPEQKHVTLQHIKRSDDELAESLPDPQFFATDHSAIKVIENFVPNTIEKFDIDGSWDLGEFSQFYGQIEDIYYIVSDIERFDDPSISPDEKSKIVDAFDRSWDGGGSYVAFYGKVANDNDYHAPLRVSGIQYNSPGHVKLHAHREPFGALMGLVKSYADNETEIRKAYNALSTFMSVNKLKKKGATRFQLTDATIDRLEEYADELDAFMPGVSFKALKIMTHDNVIVASKVLASIYRRIERLYRYFDEGRVTHPTIEVR